jgi:hypothetical protein
MSAPGEPGVGGSAATGGILCGLVTAAALGAFLAALDPYQVPDHADDDGVTGLAGSLCAAVAAVAVIAVVRAVAGRPGWPRQHVVVPLVLVPAAVVPLVTGAERNRVEAALIWGVAAVTVHLLLAYAGAGGRWRRWTAAALVLPCAAAVLVTWGCQPRWRAQSFEAVGLPLFLPEVPGYRLTGTWAGRARVSMTLSGPSGHRLFAVIEGPTGQDGDCVAGGDRRWWEGGTGQAPEHATLCLSDAAVLRLVPDAASTGLADLLPRVTVRQVDGSVLAGHPDDATMSEPD